MYARRAQIEVPAVDKPIGFDLMEYDWVAPYGKGKQSDLVFETHRRWASRQDFDSTTKITFAKCWGWANCRANSTKTIKVVRAFLFRSFGRLYCGAYARVK